MKNRSANEKNPSKLLPSDSNETCFFQKCTVVPNSPHTFQETSFKLCCFKQAVLKESHLQKRPFLQCPNDATSVIYIYTYFRNMYWMCRWLMYILKAPNKSNGCGFSLLTRSAAGKTENQSCSDANILSLYRYITYHLITCYISIYCTSPCLPDCHTISPPPPPPPPPPLRSFDRKLTPA